MADNVIAIDMGGNSWRAGFAGEEECAVKIPSAVYRDGVSHVTFVGEDATYQSELNHEQLVYPLQRGKIIDWNSVEKLFQFTFSNLHAKPDVHDVILSESPITSPRERERLAEILFETFNVRGFFSAHPAIFSLYNRGAHSGLVVECAESLSYAVAVYEGLLFPNGRAIELAGIDLSTQTRAAIQERYPDSNYDVRRIQEIKKDLLYVAENFDVECKKAKLNALSFEMETTLRDCGSKVSLGAERFRIPEIMFKPALMNSSLPGIQQIAHDTLADLPECVRLQLHSDLLLTGGTTHISGFLERFYAELTALEGNARLSLNTLHHNAAWLGASMVGSYPSFSEYLIKKSDYEDQGARALGSWVRPVNCTWGSDTRRVCKEPYLYSHVAHDGLHSTSPIDDESIINDNVNNTLCQVIEK